MERPGRVAMLPTPHTPPRPPVSEHGGYGGYGGYGAGMTLPGPAEWLRSRIPGALRENGGRMKASDLAAYLLPEFRRALLDGEMRPPTVEEEAALLIEELEQLANGGPPW